MRKLISFQLPDDEIVIRFLSPIPVSKKTECAKFLIRLGYFVDQGIIASSGNHLFVKESSLTKDVKCNIYFDNYVDGDLIEDVSKYQRPLERLKYLANQGAKSLVESCNTNELHTRDIRSDSSIFAHGQGLGGEIGAFADDLFN